MSKLPTGPHNVHIQKSQGADTNIMKFYITQNSTTYGARFDKFQPQKGRHRGTGYLCNLRPGVYYNRRLDDVDNPAMRRICDGNYRSVTQLDFQPYRDPSGLEPFPNSVKQAPSGFVREKGTVPLDRQFGGSLTWQVKGLFINTRIASAPVNILPKHTPLLHKIQERKDPLESENYGYGPRYMRTETQEKFKGEPWPSVDVSTKDVGLQEPSGFVRNINDEPITFEPKMTHGNLKPGWYTHRPTGVSVYKTSYIPKTWSRGDDPLPGGVSHGSDRGTGFTREEVKPKYINLKAPHAYDKLSDMPGLKAERTRKQDPAEYINMQHPHNRSSVLQEQLKGQMQPTPTETDRLNQTSVGLKEETGYTKNNPAYIQATDDKMRFLTHYMTRFGPDPTPVGVERAGHLRGGIQRQKTDVFTKSTIVGSYGNEAPCSQVLNRIEPYVGRSLKARNVFYDDHTHDSKIRTELIA